MIWEDNPSDRWVGGKTIQIDKELVVDWIKANEHTIYFIEIRLELVKGVADEHAGGEQPLSDEDVWKTVRKYSAPGPAV